MYFLQRRMHRKRSMKKNIVTFFLSSVVALGGNTALAQYGDYDAANAIGTGLGVGLLIFWVILMLVCLVFGIFWLWMLIDCIKRNFEQKTMWIILLIILSWIGAIAYYFAIKRKNVGGTAPSSGSSQPTPQAPPQT